MGEAIMAGLIANAGVAPAKIIATSRREDRRAYLNEKYHVTCVDTNDIGSVVKDVDTCILAVKPNAIRDVAGELNGYAGFAPARVVSIAAGITTETLDGLFNGADGDAGVTGDAGTDGADVAASAAGADGTSPVAIIRVMPNLMLSVGCGMSIVTASSRTSQEECELIRATFAAMGDAITLGEELFDVATAISGSGPAYFAQFICDLASAGMQNGLSHKQAQKLALQTMCGTGKYLQDTGIAPDALRDAVTSPGGTTQAALKSFQDSKADYAVRRAVDAAVARSKEMA
jgi:pyrroline-5-carboxylate reductase